MAGLVTVPIQPYNFNANPTTGIFSAGSAGYDNGSGIQPWSGNNIVLVPNSSGNVMLWFNSGATGAGICQVLVGQVIAGQVLTPVTARTIAANEIGWLGPFSPATYNIDNVNIVPTNSAIAGAPSGITTWPNAGLNCFAVAFTTVTTLTVRAYTFANVQP